MEKEQLESSIYKANINSLTLGAANRVVQLLQKLRFSNNENSAKRWIWELCQNAKDACNNTGKVKICIDFDKENKVVIFKHNGKAFTMDNVMSLINQSSSKDRNDEEERKSGKFGTGFLTTHLLSEIVNVSGILKTDSGKYLKFRITLDRTGNEKCEIVEALKKSVDQLQECVPIEEEKIDKDKYNTVFEYELDEDGIEVAQQGIESLRKSAPFVLSMLRDIEEISLESTGEVYRYNKKYECGLENASIHEIIYENCIERKSIYILNLTEDDITVSISLENSDGKIKIMPFKNGQSKLFCDFPLIGTEDFPFPVLVCSSYFNPTEPRDGVFLACKSKKRIDNIVDENRNILKKACGLYEKLLGYTAEKKLDGIYNITHINTYEKKEWYDSEWLDEEIIIKCKEIILHTPIICTSTNTMMQLQDYFDEEQVFIVYDSNKKIREHIWNLLHGIMPEFIPRNEDIENWCNSLWSGCNRYTFKSLTKQITEYGNVIKLQDSIAGEKWGVWLSHYYDLISEEKELQTYIAANQIKVIPNQNGVFCSVGKLYYDKNIIPEYKEILECVGDDCKEWMLHLDFRNRDWFDYDEYDNAKILKDIENKIETMERERKREILLQIVYMYDSTYSELDKQKKICQYAKDILGKDEKMKKVPVISEKLLQDALQNAITSVADKISECKDINGFAKYMNIDYENALSILAGFIEFAVKCGYENLINKSRKPILPNQNGRFMIKDNLFLDAEMDEVLKELATDAGLNIKEELLARDVFLELPESRQKNNSDVSPIITQYVNKNRTSKDDMVRGNFKKLLLWMTEHEEKSKEVFPELYKKKYYLYDDDEIATNIKQAETFNNIMNKFDISSPEKLEEIIKRNTSVHSESRDEKIEITDDILLQYGIDSERALDRAFQDSDFASKFIRISKHSVDSYEYVKNILERSKERILSFLKERDGYDLSEVRPMCDTENNTIFIIKKDKKEIYLLARPSDGGEIRIYYDTEKDLLDYSMDWELWVEDGKSDPQKITFGKVIKLAGLNRIPLRGMKNYGIK
ncbi:ATP-binding protein [Clostridium sp. ZBS12]|uniref:ATP-binding protein n=1 Tax=Clostridium sp. ZBS12 TaxID=2949972 RepID=UPI00207936DB|nr:ATP-binding protein [Clostridium sp. ZBS12]